MNFSERLRELRKSKKITQSELGKMVGVSRQSISSYERINKEPGMRPLIQLADYFNVSIDYLVRRSDERG